MGPLNGLLPTPISMDQKSCQINGNETASVKYVAGKRKSLAFSCDRSSTSQVMGHAEGHIILQYKKQSPAIKP
jgi:hypothetical protein